MAHPRKFRFGVQCSTAPTGKAWAELARKAEDLGFSTLFLPDHFGEQLAPVPAMMAAADATENLRVGALVFDNDYKHPVVLAKEVATIDVLSGGRVEFGLGAGWLNLDYEQSGIPHDSAGVRIDRMEEAIEVFNGLFGDEPCTFEGTHYKISGLDGLPKPIQRPRPPLLIGGGGRRVLSIAGREADIVGINPAIRSGNADAAAALDGTATMTDQKVQWVRDAAGARYDDLEINMLLFAVVVTDDRAQTAASMAPLFGVSEDDALQYPHAWIGTVEQICEDLIARRERWDVSYLVIQAPAMDDVAPIVAALAGT